MYTSSLWIILESFWTKEFDKGTGKETMVKWRGQDTFLSIKEEEKKARPST